MTWVFVGGTVGPCVMGCLVGLRVGLLVGNGVGKLVGGEVGEERVLVMPLVSLQVAWPIKYNLQIRCTS
jgi:hypothetical protein